PETRGGWSQDGRKVKGTLHWVSVDHAVDAEIRLYDHLFSKEDPENFENDYKENLNPNSLTILDKCKLEPSLAEAVPGTNYQFLRQGYFCVDSVDSHKDALVFNRTVTLKDSWSKIEKKG